MSIETQGFFSFSSVDKEPQGERIWGMDELTLLPTRNLVLFPGVSLPITLGRASAIEIAETAERDSTMIGVVCQLDADVENPGISDLFKYGVYARVLKVITMPDDTKMAIVQSFEKFKILSQVSGPRHLTAKVKT
ncbi:MAG: LON peptidase substrate-binding domain-containing protein, partial [Muribaculaceae bacterium]|nr:LON peptidase substrate-binding domain-containing protein [Muribaculaceae bacterium]